MIKTVSNLSSRILRGKKRNTLAYRLLLYILLLSSCITVLITVLQLYLDDREDTQFVEQRMLQIEKSYHESLANAMWFLEREQIKNILRGILQFEDIHFVEVQLEGDQSYSLGESRKGLKLRRYDVDIYVAMGSASEYAGKLIIESNLDGVIHRLGNKFWLILITQAIKTFFVSIFILSIVYYLISRHLYTIAAYTEKLDLKGLDRVLNLDRTKNNSPTDEFDQIVHAINKMRENLQKDIAERVRSVDALRESEQNLRTTLDSIGDAVIAVDLAGVVTRVNPIAEKLTGWKIAEAEGRQLSEIFNIVDARTRKVLSNPIDSVIATGAVHGPASQSVLIARDGTEYRVADSAAPIVDADGKVRGVVLVFRDVTEQYKLEQEIFKVRKLESIGVLAGGIAHDFNNILAGLFGNIELAKVKLSRDHAAYPHIETANQALKRATDLTQQFLTFAKGGDPLIEAVNIKQVIRDSIEFNLSGSNIQAVINLPDNLWQGKVDKGQVSQVVANLTINARQAMPDGGTLFVDAENIKNIEQGTVGHLSGDYVRISIRDEGVGIPEKHLEKIFDPYFTTKSTGSGLGLATVHSIVTRHNGHISIDSRPGAGTTFTLYFPAEISPHSKSEISVERVTEKSRATLGHILVMDDEAMIRDLSLNMLESFGYTVDTAVDGKKALDMYSSAAESGSPFDIVIMDLTIPGGLGGKDTITELHAIYPEAKVVVSSGYATDPIMAKYRDYGFLGKLAKPFRMGEMEKEMSRVMELG